MPINSQNKKQTKKYQINRKSRGGTPSKSKKKVRFSLPTQRSYAGIDGKPVSMKSRSSSKKYTTPRSRNSSIQQSIDRWNKQDKINREAKEKGVTPRALASVPLSIPGFKSRSELYNWKEENVFKIQQGDIATFYRIPLQGSLYLLSKAFKKHLLLLVKKKNTDQTMSIGFYPENGNFLKTTTGWVWTPDPHDLPGKKKVKYYDSNDDYIEYLINKRQAKYINDILSNSDCRLKDGSLSRGKIKRDRLECPTSDFKYSIFSFFRNNVKNCESWLHNLFPKLYDDMYGSYEEQLDNIKA